MFLLKKQITKLLIRLRGCAGWSTPLLLQITEDRFSVSESRSDCFMYMSFYHERLENKMRDLIIVKCDNSDRIVICTVSSKHLQCVCRNTEIPESKHGIH